jgi:hypothetical protein
MPVVVTAVPNLPAPISIVGPAGESRHAYFVITFDTSYPTGGYVISSASVGMANANTFLLLPNPSSGAHPVIWNVTTQKLQVFTAQGSEVGNGTDLHTFSCLTEVVGW